MNDQAATEPMSGEVSESKTLILSVGEYPELDGLEEGAPVKLTAEGTISNGGNGNVTVNIGNVQVETEGQADREYRQMRGDSGTNAPSRSTNGEDF